MKEITLIITCEITAIDFVEDEDVAMLIDADETISESIKDCLGADDVQILKNQLFVNDSVCLSRS